MHTVVGVHDLVIVLGSGQFRQRVVKPRCSSCNRTLIGQMSLILNDAFCPTIFPLSSKWCADQKCLRLRPW